LLTKPLWPHIIKIISSATYNELFSAEKVDNIYVHRIDVLARQTNQLPIIHDSITLSGMRESSRLAAIQSKPRHEKENLKMVEMVDGQA
jgi:hypothetical protein